MKLQGGWLYDFQEKRGQTTIFGKGLSPFFPFEIVVCPRFFHWQEGLDHLTNQPQA